MLMGTKFTYKGLLVLSDLQTKKNHFLEKNDFILSEKVYFRWKKVFIPLANGVRYFAKLPILQIRLSELIKNSPSP